MKLALLIGFGTFFACSPPATDDASAVIDESPPPSRFVSARQCPAGDRALFAGTPFANREGWYGDPLRAMGERPLCPEPGLERYRFLWLRTFHHPIMIRAEVSNGRAVVTGKELDGAGGYEPGKLIRDTTVELSPEQSRELKRLVAQGFWSAPAQPHPDSGRVGVDGAQWILEGTADQYHIVDRWSPDAYPREASFRQLCLFLVEAAGLKPPDELVY
jgi:hypothetical protein